MKIIVIKGIREENKVNSPLRIFVDDHEITPEKSQKIYNHSPDGFNAGYGGSGPAQTALAILLHCTHEAIARSFHQQFKWDFLANPDYQEGGFEFEVNLTKWIKKMNRGKFTGINIQKLRDANMNFSLNANNTVAMFRDDGKPMVDFYPGTGKWRIVGKGTIPGIMMPNRDMPNVKLGASGFLEWYKTL